VAFDLGPIKVYPIAIKYNQDFCDPYWNDESETLLAYLLRIFTSWNLMANIYFLEPCVKKEGEESTDFANRVKNIISKKAKLKNVPWDGYFRHIKPSERYMKLRQKIYSNSLVSKLSSTDLIDLESSYYLPRTKSSSSFFGNVLPMK